MQLETRNSKLETDDLARRAKGIKLLLMDCDGVLTDGRITLFPNGDEQKTFHVRDGQAIALFHRAGLRSGIISGRRSGATERRAAELRMAYVRQNVKDKKAAFEEILAEASVSEGDCAYIGDDVGDISIMRCVGLAVAVADAAEEAKQAAHYVTQKTGGNGAVREVIELILKVQGRWSDVVNGLND